MDFKETVWNRDKKGYLRERVCGGACILFFVLPVFLFISIFYALRICIYESIVLTYCSIAIILVLGTYVPEK